MLCETDATDLSWLYLPNANTRAHRIIYTGNFSETNNAANRRKSSVVEFSGIVDRATMEAELKHLPGNLKPVAVNSERNSYVIQDHRTRSQIASLKDSLEPQNFFLCGRFAEWEYYNMDKAIEAAMNLPFNRN
jgi:UDP-galactopyranose mutase